MNNTALIMLNSGDQTPPRPQDSAAWLDDALRGNLTEGTDMFVNLYHGKTAPLVCGARQFNTLQEAEAKASKENYFGTVQYEPKIKTVPFSMGAYEELVLDEGTHVLQTKSGKPARIIADDRLSNKGYFIVALVENSAADVERVSTYTNAGSFQRGEESDMDLILVPNQ